MPTTTAPVDVAPFAAGESVLSRTCVVTQTPDGAAVDPSGGVSAGRGETTALTPEEERAAYSAQLISVLVSATLHHVHQLRQRAGE